MLVKDDEGVLRKVVSRKEGKGSGGGRMIKRLKRRLRRQIAKHQRSPEAARNVGVSLQAIGLVFMLSVPHLWGRLNQSTGGA